MKRPRKSRITVPALLIVFVLAAQYCTGPSSSLTDGPEGASAFQPEPPPEYAHDGIRLATLNAEFLFDGAGDEGQATFPHKDDPAAAAAHRRTIGKILATLDADVIVLAEVENETVLERLVAESLPRQGYSVHFVQGTDTFTGQDVAILSRIPIESTGRTSERAPVGDSDDTYGVSKNVFARLTLGDLPVTLIGLHLLAVPDDRGRLPRREAQAEVIRRLVEKEMASGRAVAVLGDFNDYDEATLDVAGNEPITKVLSVIKSAGPGDADDLTNVMARVEQKERFTNFFDRNEDEEIGAGELSAIDHILLSPELAGRLREVTYVQSYDPRTATDHFPIVATLQP